MSVPMPYPAPVAASPGEQSSTTGPFTVSGYVPAWAAAPSTPMGGPPSAFGPVASFTPVVDLDTGGVIAIQVNTSTPAAERADVGGTVAGVRAAAEQDARLPLVLPIPLACVTAGSAGLAPLHEAMRLAGRRPREIILTIEGDLDPGDRSRLLAGIDGLRAAGYLIAFGGAGVRNIPLDVMADASPYVILISPELVERAPRDARRAAVAEALVTVAKGVAAHILAPGVQDEIQLAAVRAWGVRLATGPLLAPGDWRPADGRVHVPVPATETSPNLAQLLGPRVQEFLMPAVTLPITATSEDVVQAFGNEASITSVILVDEYQRPQSMVDRSRFLLYMAGAYGHALHAKKPAHRIADSARLVPKTTPAIAAMQVAGQDAKRVYDDLVVVDEVGRCLGTVHVSDLIRHVANRPAPK
ncbi:EAL domain-containing protein [Herbidospora daliensis]|uniref:EAL domain-containing protein n=1 Tax=Herbidospora daliensis TaxID=295585 RepID=UPI001E5AEF42|nr:EAL domain-containing protein [Herbidospora daliensis]